MVHSGDLLLDNGILSLTQDNQRTLRLKPASSPKETAYDLLRHFYIYHSSPYHSSTGASI